MKKIKFISIALFAIIALSFTACSNSNQNAADQEEVTDESGEGIPIIEEEQTMDDSDTTQGSHVHYYCPMKCEGDKVYDEDVPCPVCEMKLKETSAETH